MGAYENPAANVDTQTGQHYRNLQQSIVTTTSNVMNVLADKAEKRKKELEQNENKIKSIQLKSEDRKLEMYSDLDKISAGTPGLNLHETYAEIIDDYANIGAGLDNFTSTNRSDDIRKMAAYKASPGLLRGDLASLASIDGQLTEGIKNIGKVGGLYTGILGKGGVDPDFINWWQVYKGEKPGTIKSVVDRNDPTKRSWNATWNGEDGREITYPMDGNKFSKLSDSSGGVVTYIPDQFNHMQDSKMRSGVYSSTTLPDAKGNSVQKIGNIAEEYLGKVIYEEADDIVPGKKVENVFRDINEAKIRGALKPIDYEDASALIASDNGRSAEAWYNTMYKDSKDFSPRLAKDIITSDGKEAFKKAYHDYHVASIPKRQVVLSADSRQAQKITDTTPGGSGSGGAPLSENAKLKIEKENAQRKRSLELLNNKNNSDPILSPDLKQKMQWDNGDKKWYAYRLNPSTNKYNLDDKTPGKTSRNEMAKIIGLID